MGEAGDREIIAHLTSRDQADIVEQKRAVMEAVSKPSRAAQHLIAAENTIDGTVSINTLIDRKTGEEAVTAMKLITAAVFILFFSLAMPVTSAPGKESCYPDRVQVVENGKERGESASGPSMQTAEGGAEKKTIAEPAAGTVSETEEAAAVPKTETEKSVEEVMPASAHEHTWTAVTEIIHHNPVYQAVHHEAEPEQVWVEDVPAYDETYENTCLVGVHAVCKGCGIDLDESGMSDEEIEAHDLIHILNGEESSYYEVPVFQTVTEVIHHDSEGHYEKVDVKDNWDEEVLISEAWDEDVVTGYICEECGEVR